MKKQQSKKSGLIPKYWDLPVQTEDDLVFLGKTTIREIIREWRREAKGLAGRMKEIDEELSLLADIRENASKYSDPDFTGQKLKYDLMAGKRGPTEEKDLNRTWQSTTFNRCGWCRYAQGMRTHGVSLDPGCGINYDAGLKDEDRQFSTTCFLKGVTDELILQIRQGLQQKLVSLTGQKRAIDGKIKKLIELKAKAES
ncbi:MAG: hypothetical protein NT094_02140, partial [Candidatus Staskawiczbacteria bacterium]|nr:hypothetical protein [Candidatus Staskawiczbacteria bacterium]